MGQPPRLSHGPPFLERTNFPGCENDSLIINGRVRRLPSLAAVLSCYFAFSQSLQTSQGILRILDIRHNTEKTEIPWGIMGMKVPEGMRMNVVGTASLWYAEMHNSRRTELHQAPSGKGHWDAPSSTLHSTHKEGRPASIVQRCCHSEGRGKLAAQH